MLAHDPSQAGKFGNQSGPRFQGQASPSVFASLLTVSPARVMRNSTERKSPVSKLLRGLAAGYGAKKMGGGCLSTILIFIVLWWLLGNFEIFQ